MKNKIFINLLLLITMVSTISCSKDQEPTSTTFVFNRTLNLSNRETIQFNLGVFGQTEDVVILQNPTQAEINNLFINDKGQLIYAYKATPGYIGRDYVRFRSLNNPINEPDSKVIWEANFTIEISN